MILARQREDLLDEGTLIPVKLFDKPGVQYEMIDEWVPVIQPDELDNSEFNLLILGIDDDGSYKLIGVGISVDFEFKSELEQQYE